VHEAESLGPSGCVVHCPEWCYVPEQREATALHRITLPRQAPNREQIQTVAVHAECLKQYIPTRKLSQPGKKRKTIERSSPTAQGQNLKPPQPGSSLIKRRTQLHRSKQGRTTKQRTPTRKSSQPGKNRKNRKKPSNAAALPSQTTPNQEVHQTQANTQQAEPHQTMKNNEKPSNKEPPKTNLPN
jgi:hypothetical protein